MKGWVNSKYRIIKEIGRGKDSSIYLCEAMDEFYDTVALKVYQIESLNTNVSMYFQRECDVLSMMNHEGIVKILDKGYCTRQKVYFIALEYIEGNNLENIIKKNEIKKFDKTNMINQIIKAVEYSHYEGILHRDLKPSNIMITNDGKVKIIDFGISKILNDIKTDSEMTIQALTYKYASPEQKACKELDERSDLYSLVLIIYEILVEQSFKLDIDIITQIRNISLSKDVKSFFMKGLEFDRELRFSNIADLKKQWRDLESKEQKNGYYASLSNNAIKKISELVFKESLSNQEANKIVTQDLDIATMAAGSRVYKAEESNKYIIWGNQFEYNCAIDTNGIKIISIAAPEIRTLEWRKEEFGYKIEHGIYFDNSIKLESIDELLNKYGEFDRRKYMKKNNVVSQKTSLINMWRDILKAQKNMVKANKKTYMYSSINLEVNNILSIKLRQDIDIEFNQDDILVLTDVENTFNCRKAGYFNSYRDGKIYIDMFRGLDYKIFAKSGEISIDTAYIDTIITKQSFAMKKLLNSESVNSNLYKILKSEFIPRKEYLTEHLTFKNKELDFNKQKLLENAIESRDIYLLQGPPGTGKTTFISELVNQQLKINPNSKILITSQSNVAVNHAMAKLKSDSESLNIVRLGREESMSSGMELYTILYQQDKLIESIKKKSESYFAKIRKKNFSSDIIERVSVLEEVTDLNEKISRLSNELLMDKKWLSEKKKVIESTNEFNEKIIKLKDKLFDVNIDLSGNLGGIVEEYISVGEMFIKKIENIKAYKGEIESYESLIMEKEKKIPKINADLIAGLNVLGLDNIKEIDLYKKKIEPELAKEKNKIKKFSRYERIKNNWIKSISNTNELGRIMMEEVEVIGATCIGIANYVFNFDLKFDLVIIDEAGRASIPEVLVPMILGKKIIMVGDHKQLPPTINGDLIDNNNEIIKSNNKKVLEISLFEYLQGALSDDFKGVLREQYRMTPIIGELVSKVFYENQLITGIDESKRTHKYNKFEGYSIVWCDTSNSINRKEESVGVTKRNRYEAEGIVNLLLDMDKLYKELAIRKTVAIITGYKAQKNLITNLIERLNKELKYIDIEVDTVDAFQGRETDIVIYSIVRSNNKNQIGFLRDSRRLNVAFSRAKELLIIFGDKNFVKESNSDFSKILDFVTTNKGCMVQEVNDVR